MNNKYIEKFSRNIVINTSNLKNQCDYFINHLEKKAKKYAENIKKESDEFNKLYKKNKKIIFTPENLLNVSPITILDAPWGAGKTFFIESLCKYVLKDEIKLNYIKKIIVIDSWKYSISNVIPTDFIFYLVEKLASTLKLKDDITKLFINFLNSSAVSMFNKFTGTSFKIKDKNLENIHIDDVIDKLNDCIKEPILIIVDNIERIGENGWEILKTIQRLAMLNNLIFVLPMNKDKLVKEKLGNSEWKIEKYINIPFYIFKQDYIGVLKKYNIRDDLVGIFNYLLTQQIDGECLSIRELDKILSEENIDENFENKYKGLIYFNEIWSQEDESKKFIIDDIELFLNIINEIKGCIDLFNDMFQKNEYHNIVDQVYKHAKVEIENYIPIGYVDWFKNIQTNIKKINYYWSSVEVIKEIDFQKLINDELGIQNSFSSKIKENEKEIEKIEASIKKLKEFIDKYELDQVRKTSANNKKYSKSLEELPIHENSLIQWNRENDSFKKEIEIKQSNIEEINQLINDFKKFEKDTCEIINNIHQKFDDNIKQNENMLLIFEILFKNNYFLNNQQNIDINDIYNYFLSEIKNS